MTERLEVHAEWFGTFTQGLVDDTHRPFFSPGTHFMLADNVEIGLRVGWGLTDEAAPFFSDTGLALHYEGRSEPVCMAVRPRTDTA